jgi:hypothetical protein
MAGFTAIVRYCGTIKQPLFQELKFQLLYFNELKFQLMFESFGSQTKFNGLITKSNLELFLSWFGSLSTLQDSELVDYNTDRKHA